MREIVNHSNSNYEKIIANAVFLFFCNKHD